MLSQALEDWLTDAGDVVIRKRMNRATSVSPIEALVYEIWLLDTEARNGGLSQYFCNHGAKQWQSCVYAAHALGLHSFVPFQCAVTSLIAGDRDPCEALLREGERADNLWYAFQEPVVAQLRQLCSGAP